ncbi:unnamed protein product [Rotaria magnacalcarata]|uniref:Uncharacterized protein n=2 Tax=Rotaria magnacalcarata TaxID=392030 RepID=A0A816RMN8_9BILA|nr:unnamed protein product [Rotaria magnacalcarata]CAF2075244.1 unnamed protein product [Rotaria magnacalcarata]CAF3793128.1 unnamed protein product [Rotaria magnacalcarata]CAF3986312.1 unnamed protein product [Rotaria magnacalcarata]CAF4652759.1 unnamed protein product [Rotaria magnacalcarata]
MMFISSSTITINNFYCILIILFIPSTCSYVLQTDDLKNSITDQQYGLNIPLYYDRFLRTTKFPRIGRSPSGTAEIPSSDGQNLNVEENAGSNNDNDFRWLEQRSVFFPRIGKRANNHVLWGNTLSSPYRMLDGQGRYHINDYEYHVRQSQPGSMTNYEVK